MADPMVLMSNIRDAQDVARKAQEEVDALVEAQETLLALETVWYGPEDEHECPDGWYPLWCPIIPGAVGYVRPPELIEVNGDNDVQNGYASSIRSKFGQRMSLTQIIESSAKASAYVYADLIANSISERVLSLKDD